MAHNCNESFLSKHWLTIVAVGTIVIFVAVFEVMEHSMQGDKELRLLIEHNKETIKKLESQLRCDL